MPVSMSFVTKLTKWVASSKPVLGHENFFVERFLTSLINDCSRCRMKYKKVFEIPKSMKRIKKNVDIFKKFHCQRLIKKSAKKSAFCARAHQFLRAALTLRSFQKNWAALLLRSRKKERRSERSSKERRSLMLWIFQPLRLLTIYGIKVTSQPRFRKVEVLVLKIGWKRETYY